MEIELEKLGNLAQMAYVKEVVNVGGMKDGLRELIIKNGGLYMTILVGRAFDIGELSINGLNVSYISKSGFVSPNYAYTEAFPYMRSFSGGMLMTCGLDNIGNPTATAVQHGRLPAAPAEIVRKEVEIVDGKAVVTVEADIKQAELFGENLTLRRKYVIQSDCFEIFDTVYNLGFTPYGTYLMYHFNFGYPFLNADTVIDFTNNPIASLSEKAAKNIKNAKVFCQPEKDFFEECYIYQSTGKTQAIKVRTPSQHLACVLSYNTDNLPFLTEWKNPLSGEYVLGIEPASTRLDKKEPTTIAPQDSIQNHIKFSFETL